MNSSPAIAPTDTVQLAPSYRLPAGLLLLALPLVWLQVWVGAAVGLFAVFLGVQAATLRLHFTDAALDIFRGETLIRRFPYQDWQNWAIFWPPVPILFYFKEVNSIHFLPILFDPNALQACLEQRCPTVSE
ncbi:MAG: DUF3119 family protein [Cyanobacteria bacterium J069]|nr:MAG: DUF3119 family protein [Cyanobacteria bacterium J069]